MSFSLPGAIRQNGYVVADLEAAARAWVAVGVGPWVVIPEVTASEFEYRGQPGEVRMSIALSYSGDLQLELIEQHGDDPSMYREFREARGEGLQHHAWWTEEFEATVEGASEAGWTIGHRGDFGGLRVVYFDGPMPHTSLELMEDTELTRGVFAQVREAVESWDGRTEPVRPL